MVFPLDYIYPQGAPAKQTTPTPKSSGSGYYSSGAAPEHSGYYSNSQEPLHLVYPRGTNDDATSPQGVSDAARLTKELRRQSSNPDIPGSTQSPGTDSPSSGLPHSSTKSQPRTAPVLVFVRPQELPSFSTVYVKERVAQSPFSRDPGMDHRALCVKEHVARGPFSSTPAVGQNQQHDYRPKAIKERVALSPFSTYIALAPRTINPGPNKGIPVSHGSSILSRKSSFSKTLMPVLPYTPRSTTSSMRAECGSCASSSRSSQSRPPHTGPGYTTHNTGHDHKRSPSGPSDAAAKQSRRISSVSGSLKPPMEPSRAGGNGRSTLPRQPSNGMLRVHAESCRAGGSVNPLSRRMSVTSLRPPPDHVRSSSGSTLSRKRSMSSLPCPTGPFGAGGSGPKLLRQRSVGTLVGTPKPTRELKSALKKPAGKGAGGPKKVSFSNFNSVYYPTDEH